MGQHDSFLSMSDVVHSSVTVTTSSANILGTPSAKRKYIRILNFSGVLIFVNVGGTATITDWPIAVGAQENFGVNKNTIVTAITASATADIRIMEYS